MHNVRLGIVKRYVILKEDGTALFRESFEADYEAEDALREYLGIDFDSEQHLYSINLVDFIQF